jgi:hypothetical protein
MIETTLLRVNEPNIVHETIDGETILLDLNTGNYFSLAGSGAIIWDFIHQTGDWKRAIAILADERPGMHEHIVESVTAFIESLVEEKLLVLSDLSKGPVIPPEIEDQLKTAAQDFIAPQVNKYSDMQDLLLLDPIHDVDERGWPESKEIQGNG